MKLRKIAALTTVMGVITAAIVLGFSMVTLQSAFAAGDPTCVTYDNGTTVCTTSAASQAKTDITIVDVASPDVKSVVNLRFEVSKAYTPVAKCYKTPSFTKVPKGAKCWIATQSGYHFQNSGVNRNGQRQFFDDYIGSKYSPVGSQFYLDAPNHSWRKSNCRNFVKFTGTQPSLKVSQVVLVKVFQKITATAQAVSSATGDSAASASCSVNGASAYARAEYSFAAVAIATASASAMTETQARAGAQNQFTADQLKQLESQAQANAAAATLIKATGSATANASCSTSNSPPQQTPPTCQNVYGPGYSGQYPNCTKDGTTQPPPPSQAPGPNPSPSNTTSSQCYDPNTGQPVAPGTPGARCQ